MNLEVFSSEKIFLKIKMEAFRLKIILFGFNSKAVSPLTTLQNNNQAG